MDMDHQLQKVKNFSVRKGKNGILHVIFGRTGILLLCLIAQILLLFLGMQFLAQYIYLLFGGYLAFGCLMAAIVLGREENPVFQLTWAVIVLVVPVFGGLLYLYIQLQPGTKVLGRRMKEVEKETQPFLLQDPMTQQLLYNTDIRAAQLMAYVYKEDGYPVYRNTEVTYFGSGEEMFAELLARLSNALRFIFLEYFIIDEGYMWDSVFEILRAKVQEGVEVRLIYDGMNELYHLPPEFAENIRKAGIRCKVFSPVYPVISTHYNNRDHRKIVVIDGHTAFTGGVNLADEYINRKERFGHWKDAAIMLNGEAVRSFTVMFLRMWAVTGALDDVAPYLRPHEALAEEPRGFVMPYGANPFGKERTAERVYIDILNNAVRYVHIMTPYLVPGHEMMQALCYAAKRGVDVKLILPHIPDKKYAFALAHSYYKKLMQSGVHIFEYTPGFVHSKIFVSDDICSVVGAINLDYRSLYLNFECAALLYGAGAIREIEADFRRTLPKCQLMTMYDIRHDKITRKLTGMCLKIFAPLM